MSRSDQLGVARLRFAGVPLGLSPPALLGATLGVLSTRSTWSALGLGLGYPLTLALALALTLALAPTPNAQHLGRHELPPQQ